MGVENRIKQQYGFLYWEEHKPEIVDKLQGVPQVPPRVFGENSRSRRAERRGLMKKQTIIDINRCVMGLREEDATLSQIAKFLGIPRSTLYRHRRGLVRTSLLRETLRRCEGLV